MNNRRPRHETARLRKIDVTKMREDARKLLGWAQLDHEEAADMVCVSRRTWSKYEEKNPKPIPDSVVKLFCFEVGLAALEQAESDKKLKDVLSGELSMKGAMDFVHDFWGKWDPVEQGGEKAG